MSRTGALLWFAISLVATRVSATTNQFRGVNWADPGDNFQIAIVHAIRSAKVMVLVFSSNSNNSDEIKKELVLAGQSRLIVIPVRVEDVTPDDAGADGPPSGQSGKDGARRVPGRQAGSAERELSHFRRPILQGGRLGRIGRGRAPPGTVQRSTIW